MSQQINLINPALIKQKDFLTVVNIGVVYGVLTGLMMAWVGYSASQVHGLQGEQQALAASLAHTQSALTQLLASRAPRSPDPALLQQLALLESKQNMQAKMLDAIQQRKPPQDFGLANYMRGFARQIMPGVWLSGFTIDEKNKTMTVRGRSLEAESLPDYVQKLAKEPVFAGKAFGGLRIKQAEWQASRPKPDNQEASRQHINPALRINPAPALIEFELQGLERLPMQTVTRLSEEQKS